MLEMSFYRDMSKVARAPSQQVFCYLSHSEKVLFVMLLIEISDKVKKKVSQLSSRKLYSFITTFYAKSNMSLMHACSVVLL